MSDAESAIGETLDQPKQDSQDRKPSSDVTYSLWPPTDRTRQAVVDRLIETLTTPSPLSRRYGTLTADEAKDQSQLIEQEAFAAAGGSAATEVSGETGMNILQIYSKEISKRMLEVVKAKSAAANGASESGVAASSVGSEEVKSEEMKTEESTT